MVWAAGLLESVVWDSAGSESAGQNKRPDAAGAWAPDGDAGTGSRRQFGCRSAKPPDDQSRLCRLRSATRIGAPSRSPREDHDPNFSSRHGRDQSISFDHDIVDRLGYEFSFNQKWVHGNGSDGIAAPVSSAAVDASALKARIDSLHLYSEC